MLQNNDQITDWNDECPIHGGELTKEYNFGHPQVPAATVYMFQGCKCAATHEGGGINTLPRYFTDYGAAAGLARMIKAEHNSKY